jgi:membrane protein
VGSTFGAAGSLAVLLIWVYYSSQILFLGAEFTQVYANRHGEKIVPAEGAIKVTEGDRLRQGIPRKLARDISFAGSPRITDGIYPSEIRNRYREKKRSKVLDTLLLASQFIPTLRSMYASKSTTTQRT